LNNNSKNKKPEKKKSTAIAVITLVLALFSLADSTDGDAGMFIGFVIIIAAIVGIIFAVVKIVNKAIYGDGKKPVTQTKTYSAVNKWSRDSAETPIAAPASRPKSFVYDDKAYERNTERDMQRRIAQLDDFLKNGIIDKEEYRILRERYEKRR